MSRLEELIKALCPDGVEYVKLKDCTEMKRGTSATKSTLSEGQIPVVSGGKEPAFYCNVSNRNGETLTVAGSGAGAGYVQYWNEPIFVNDAFSIKGIETLSTRYVYHNLLNMQTEIYATKKGSGVPHVHISSIENFLIPFPPLPVQEEIVRILDNFTELTAELTARKKQFEYYRDSVFESNILANTNFSPLSAIADVRDGTHDSPKPTTEGKFLITSKNVKNGTVNFENAYLISLQDFNSINQRSKVDLWDLLFTMIGTVGEIGLIENEPDFAIKNVGLIKTGDEIISRFLKYYLTTSKVKKYVENNRSKGSQVFLALGKLRNLPIPVLEKATMEHIVDILDHFDTLCNDISKGLPAEIEARQKQYEYYRDKLLTFKNIDAEE